MGALGVVGYGLGVIGAGIGIGLAAVFILGSAFVEALALIGFVVSLIVK